MNLKHLFETILHNVSKKNEADENVKTADPKVFEAVKKKVETSEHNLPTGGRRSEVFDDYMEKILQAKDENVADPNVETADNSVFDDLLKEIEVLKEKVNAQESTNATNQRGAIPPLDPLPPIGSRPQPAPQHTSRPAPPAPAAGTQAMTNSQGGSLQLRAAPDMGAQKVDIRVPDRTLLRVIQYSENSIMLDGRRSRFALVDYNGQRGWILENYLNFN